MAARPRIDRRLAIAIVAGAAGLILNLLPIPAIGGLSIGRVLTLPIAILFGPWLGLVASMIAAAGYGANVPARIVMFGCEALAIGLLTRRGYSPVVSGGFYWLAMAVVFMARPVLFGSAFAVYAGQEALAFALQRNLQVMVPVVLAKLVVVLGGAHRLFGGPRPRSLRTHAFDALEVAAVLPVLLLGVVSSQLLSARQEAEGTSRVIATAGATRDLVEEYVAANTRVMETLAETLAETGDDRARQARLLDSHGRLHPAFRGALIADPGGTVLLLEEAGEFIPPSTAQSLGDRPYFRTVLQTRRAALSDTQVSRAGERAPVVVISAPFFGADGQLRGVVNGALQLSALGRFVEEHVSPPLALITILDRNPNIIYASPGSGRTTMQSLAGDALVRQAGSPGTTYQVERQIEGDAQLHLTAAAPAEMGWTVFVEEPLLTMRLQTTRYYTITLGLIALALTAAVLAARRFSRMVTAPLEQMVTVVRQVSVQQSPDAVEATMLSELDALAHDVNSMQWRLSQSYHQLQASLSERDTLNTELRNLTEDLDHKVRERTAELAAATQLAEAASRTKSEFLANMSHEIRTPMNGILGMADLALTANLPAAEREYIETVHQSATALLVIIDDILDFSKIEAGRLELETIDFSPRTIIDEALRPLAPRAEAKQLSLRVDISPAVPDAVIGDPTRVRQVLMNLVANAVKFTHAGHVAISARTEPAPPGMCTLVLSVVDTGIGIEADAQATVFQPFTQADGSTTRRYGGTGLGLTISAQLVELMGGRIWLESEPGRGSAFHVRLTLPVGASRPASRLASRPAQPRETAVRSNAAATRALRVLVVEDNSVNRRLAQHLLERQGHIAHLAENGRQALEAIQSGRFDLVLMDLQMPEMDGFEATAAIRNAEREAGPAGPPRLPIVALTAHAMHGDRQRCLDAGMDDYVSKPIKPADLFDAIERVLTATPRT